MNHPKPAVPETMATTDEMVGRICNELRTRQRFLLTSHVRPDGDSIGSQLALAYALTRVGKQVRIVNHDAATQGLAAFRGVDSIDIADHVEGDYDAAVVLECGDLDRTGVSGLERYFIINIDHHPGNAMYGAINWFDATAAACGEMVFDLIKGLGVALDADIATHVYLAILTDTGSFHYSSISPRTFDICRQTLETGIDPVTIARTVFDSNNVGRLRLFGAVLSSIQIDGSGRLATLYLDHQMARQTGGTYDDTEGLINLPLTVKEVQAVAFFKEAEDGNFRISLRSKGDIDVCRVAKQFGGGGHKNAAGCTVPGPYAHAYDLITGLVVEAIDRA
jgi:phosphoesterase RecJ-like protein